LFLSRTKLPALSKTPRANNLASAAPMPDDTAIRNLGKQFGNIKCCSVDFVFENGFSFQEILVTVSCVATDFPQRHKPK
jgi:hypothetical protein